MRLRSAFWRFAHERYQSRAPRWQWELIAFFWAGLFGLAYLGGLLADFRGTLAILPGAILFVVSPALLGWLHRLIRLEQNKGSDALYRKRISCR